MNPVHEPPLHELIVFGADLPLHISYWLPNVKLAARSPHQSTSARVRGRGGGSIARHAEECAAVAEGRTCHVAASVLILDLREGDGAAAVGEEAAHRLGRVRKEGAHLGLPRRGGRAVDEAGDVRQPEGEAAKVLRTVAGRGGGDKGWSIARGADDCGVG